jgi:integrase-like protein
MKLWPKGLVRAIRFHDLRHTYASVLLMLGANLVSVQKLLGHSDPKITERRYGHLLPEFMSAEVNRLRFGLDQLAPTGAASQRFAGAGSMPVTLELQSEGGSNEEAGTPRISPSDPGLLVGGEYGTRTRGLRRDRPAL